VENALKKSYIKEEINPKIDKIDKILEDEISNNIDVQIPVIDMIFKL